MGLFDSLSDAINSGANDLKAIQNIALPPEIENLKKADDAIAQKLVELESATNLEGNRQAQDQIIYLRTSLMTHFGHLVRGGDPEPVVGGKMHPLYKTVADAFADRDSRVAALEKKYFGCTFGYQMPDGQIEQPALDWSEEEWFKIKSQSKDQLARCWVDTDHSQYF